MGATPVNGGRGHDAARRRDLRHSCLSPEPMRKWRVGVLPMDGGTDKRGFSLRGQVIYPVQAEGGQVRAYFGQDPLYEENERDFSRLTPTEPTEASAAMKHRFPKGFHRGLELFGRSGCRRRFAALGSGGQQHPGGWPGLRRFRSRDRLLSGIQCNPVT